MIKRCFTIICLAISLLYPIHHTSFAINLTQSNYVKIIETANSPMSVYINTLSPVVIQQDPPHYSIKGEIIIHNADADTTAVYEATYHYNTDTRSIAVNCPELSDYINRQIPDPAKRSPFVGSFISIGNAYFMFCYGTPFL